MIVQNRSITFEQLQEVAKVLVPENELQDIRSILIEPSTAVVEVYAKDRNGSKYLDDHGSIAMHRIIWKVERS